MGTVNSKVVLYKAVLNVLDAMQVEALEHTVEEIHKEIKQAQVMPFDKGTLQGEGGTFTDYSMSKRGKVMLISNTPYARRLYYHPEYHFSTEENPNAGGKWLKEWLKGGDRENRAYEIFKESYLRLTGLR